MFNRSRRHCKQFAETYSANKKRFAARFEKRGFRCRFKIIGTILDQKKNEPLGKKFRLKSEIKEIEHEI